MMNGNLIKLRCCMSTFTLIINYHGHSNTNLNDQHLDSISLFVELVELTHQSVFCPLCSISTDSKSWISFVTTIGTKRMASERGWGETPMCHTFLAQQRVGVMAIFWHATYHSIQGKCNLGRKSKVLLPRFPPHYSGTFYPKEFFGLELD